jgi:hypothetical protein
MSWVNLKAFVISSTTLSMSSGTSMEGSYSEEPAMLREGKLGLGFFLSRIELLTIKHLRNKSVDFLWLYLTNFKNGSAKCAN